MTRPEESHTVAEIRGSRRFSGYALFLLTVIVLVYIQTLTFGFLEFDDTPFLVQNPLLREWSSVRFYFTGAAHTVLEKNAQTIPNFYRPITGFSTILYYKFFGSNPVPWRASVLALYLLGVWLVWRIAWKLTRDDFVALAAALLYGLHPLHVEGVAWLSGACVETLLATLFLGSFLAYLEWREQRESKWLVLFGGLMLLSLLTKESAAALPILILVHAFLFRSDDPPRLGPVFLTLLAAGIPYAMLRMLAIHGVVASHPYTWADVFRTAPLVFWIHLKHAFWPASLATWYDIRFVTALTARSFYFPLIACIAYGMATIWALIRSRLIGFLLLWWGIALSPAIGGLLVFNDFELVHDRFAFIALTGPCIAAALALRMLPQRGPVLFGYKATAVAALGVLVLVMGIQSGRQVNFWRNDLAMNAHAVEVSPRVLTPRILLGNLLMRRKDVGRALALYRDTLALDPDHWQTLFAYGITLAYSGDTKSAEAMLRHGIAVAPNKAPLYYVLADVLADMGRRDEAIAIIEQGIPIVDQPDILRAALARLTAAQRHGFPK